jgi:Ca2+-binding RTX toxin-like protein
VVALKDNGATTLSGTAEANSTVSIYDRGTTLIGTATVGADGTWSLQATVSGNVVHSFTEISKDATAYTVSSTGVTLYAPAAHELLQAGSGNDVLIGGPNDTLIGGQRPDTFVFNPGFGKDTIYQFNPDHDVLSFHHTFANLTAVQHATHQVGANTVITYDANDTITLMGISVSQLHFDASHFLLA